MSSQDDWLRKRIFQKPEIKVNALPKPPQIGEPRSEPLQALEIVSRGPYYGEYPEFSESPEDPFAKLVEYWSILRQRKIVILVLTIIGVLTGLAYNVLQEPKFRARVSMEIQGPQEALSAISLASPNDASIQTQVDILKSNPMLDRAETKLAQATHSELKPPGDLFTPWRKALGIQLDWGTAAWREAVSTARRTLQIKSSRESRIITLQCDSINPQVAAEFTNTLANEYIEQRLEDRWAAYQNTSKWLNQAQVELKAKLEASEQELQRFARSSGLLFISDSQNVSEEKLNQLQSELSRAQAQRIAKEAQYEASKSSKPEALPEVLDSGPIRTYQVQLTDLQRQLAELSSALTPEHYKIKRLQAQIAELESALSNERTNIIKRIRNEYDSALRTENQIRAEYDRQVRLISGDAENLIHYRILKREAETNRQLYELTLQKGKEASIASALRASDARVVDPARPANAPYKPILALNLAAGLTGGLFFASSFVLVSARLRATVHLPGNLPMRLSVRELGVIPSAKIDRLNYGSLKHSLTSRSGRVSLPSGKRFLRLHSRDGHSEQSSLGLELLTKNQSNSIMAEAFRAIMASILFSCDSSTGRPQVIVFTSPSPREGKTTVVSNLGIALAEIEHRVLLLDGDMRIPRLHNIFGISNGWGLSNLLHEKTPIEEYTLEEMALRTEIPNLWVLPSGSARTNLSTLLYSSRFAALLARCRCEFSIVLVDAPPVLNVPDARILSRAADSSVLVFRASSTTRDEAMAAMRCFEEDGTTILGTIMNDWNPNIAGYGNYRSPYSYRYDAY
jgi:succinoglycan biosynthesis transport protein ExoP